jgi:hypothetical protein
MNVSCDLMLLAAIAYKKGKYKEAGSLFSASMTAEDSDGFLDHLNTVSSERHAALSSVRQTLDIPLALSESMLEHDDEFVIALSAEVSDPDETDPGPKQNAQISEERLPEPEHKPFTNRPNVIKQVPDNKLRPTDKPLDEEDTYDTIEGDEYSDTLIGQKVLVGALIPAENELIQRTTEHNTAPPTQLRPVTQSPVTVSG